MSAFDLSAAVRDTMESGGESLAIAFGGIEYPWRWIALVARTLNRIVQDAGLSANAPLALIARNRPAHVATMAAQMAAHRTTCMVYSAQSPAGIARDLETLRTPIIVADEQDWTDEAVIAASRLGGVGIILSGDLEAPVRLHPQLTAVGVGPFKAASTDIAFEMLSSGTTGPPKRTPLRWDTVAAATDDARLVYAGISQIIAPQLMIHPIGNIAGVSFLAPPLAFGQAIALLEKFEVDAWANAIERYRPVRTSLPAAAVRMILESDVPREKLSSLSLVAVGGARIEPELRDAFEERYGIPVLLAFGATEFGGVVANWTLDLYREFGATKRESVGRPSPGVTFRMIDPESHAELPVDSIGIIEARVTRLGSEWIRTTDLGRIDADGFVYLHGRADGAINRGGFKIVPESVAVVLRRHPAVADAAVVGIPDARLGEVPVAAVELKRDAPAPGLPELAEYARAHLLAYQVPTQIRIVSALPRTLSMKVSLSDVRALFESAE